MPLGPGVTPLACDANGLVAFNKPAGLLSHPNVPKDEPRSLLTTRYDADGEFYEWLDIAAEGETGVMARLWLLNRLDSATSGVILAAASQELADEIKAQFRQKRIRKIYRALVFGAPTKRQQIWRDRLTVSKRDGRIRAKATGNLQAESQMKLVRAKLGREILSLLQLEPRTGRSHQLRVQCAKRNLPLVGDLTYGDFRHNRDFAQKTGHRRLFLHSLETSFDYDFKGQRFSFLAHAPQPPEFEKLL
jgi:23S rRNA-/tRNA-specific pseudouridylate synthase